MADFSGISGTIFNIRYDIYKRKFFIKFLNNFINQITPFFFYAIGGYLVILGDLSFGALVAVLAAYKDLASPWRELLNYYQRVEDARIKYEQVALQFQPEDIIPTEQLTEDRKPSGPMPGEMVFTNVTVTDDEGTARLEGVSLSMPTDRHIAVVGDANSGKDTFLMLCARLEVPTGGRIRLGDDDLESLPESITGRQIAFVDHSTYILTASLRTNLYYPLKHRPLRSVQGDEAEEAARRRRLTEALASGNTTMDVGADWIDYEAAATSNAEELQARALEVLRLVEMENDVYRMGLTGTIDGQAHSELKDSVLDVRRAIRDHLATDPETAKLIELFDVGTYNSSATVAENLLFGSPVGPVLSLDHIAEHPYVLSVLGKVGLVEEFLRIGTEVAETMIELFADLPPGHEFFEQFSFISSEELPDFQPLIAKVRSEGYDDLREDARARLIALPFKLIVSRHRLGLIDEAIQERIVKARHLFADELPEDLGPSIEFFDADRYSASASLQDNMLFGKVAYGPAGNQERVQRLIAQMVGEAGLRETVVAVGLDRSVGVAGARLSMVQRQKLALARALLKRPDLLVLNEATSNLDGASQQRVSAKVREMFAGKGLIWGVHRPSQASDFDEVVVIKGGKLAERGAFDDLARSDGALKSLMDAE